MSKNYIRKYPACGIHFELENLQLRNFLFDVLNSMDLQVSYCLNHRSCKMFWTSKCSITSTTWVNVLLMPMLSLCLHNIDFTYVVCLCQFRKHYMIRRESYYSLLLLPVIVIWWHCLLLFIMQAYNVREIIMISMIIMRLFVHNASL